MRSRKEFNLAMAKMEANGWRHILSVMSGDPGDKNYGCLFTKGEREFWFNIDTVPPGTDLNNLPV